MLWKGALTMAWRPPITCSSPSSYFSDHLYNHLCDKRQTASGTAVAPGLGYCLSQQSTIRLQTTRHSLAYKRKRNKEHTARTANAVISCLLLLLPSRVATYYLLLPHTPPSTITNTPSCPGALAVPRFKIPEKFRSKFRFRAIFRDFWPRSHRYHFLDFAFFRTFLIKESEMWQSYHKLLNIDDLW
jgi:hypothetical protein